MIQIYLSNIRCGIETNEVGADEPYALVTAVDLTASVRVAGVNVPLPAYQVVRYGPFEDVDKDETHFAPGTSQSFWGMTGRPAPLSDPNQVIFVVALMENDEGNPELTRGMVQGLVSSSLFGSLAFDRAERVTRLIRDINSAIQAPIAAAVLDEQIGPPQEIRFSAEELARAERGELVSTTVFTRGDGGYYYITFQAVNEFGLFGAIRDRWVALGRIASPLSIPTSDEFETFDRVGRSRNFVNGMISWHPETGAHGVWGLIGKRWLQVGREKFGYPITDELPTDDRRGRYNHFRAVHLPGKPEASIYWSEATGAHEVYGGIRNKWASLGWERSSVGYPIEPEHNHPGGRLQRFERGALFWNGRDVVVVP